MNWRNLAMKVIKNEGNKKILVKTCHKKDLF